MSKLLIAATHKSSGKTTISIGIAAALTRLGRSVQPFKKGPDYIDPMWLARAAGRPCYNLDFNTQTEREILTTFSRHSSGADLALIETNKGLYDGVDLEGSDSNAAMAGLLDVPVVLVIDTEGITRGIAPLLVGYLAFGEGINIAGVILNKVAGPRHEGKLRAAVERYSDLKVLGAVRRNPELTVEERHLGLQTPSETGALEAKITAIADAIAGSVDLDALERLAASTSVGTAPSQPPPVKTPIRRDVRIAIARDRAFGFYYADDLEALQAAGADLIPFDALTTPRLPEADGLLIGGGFPEMEIKALEANASLRKDIRTKLHAGMPAYAECGGLMYLCRSLSFGDQKGEMVGTLAADAVMCERPQGRGYVRLKETLGFPWPAAGTRSFGAHEFHYARLDNVADDLSCVYEVKRGFGIDGRRDGIHQGNLLAAFSHQRDTEANHWAGRFVAFVRRCKGA